MQLSGHQSQHITVPATADFIQTGGRKASATDDLKQNFHCAWKHMCQPFAATRSNFVAVSISISSRIDRDDDNSARSAHGRTKK